MAKILEIRGVREAIAKMARKQGIMARQFGNGLKKAGLYLQNESMAVVPVDIGNLKGSAFTRAAGQGFQTVVAVGYTTAYAIFVHENLENLHGEAFNLAYADKINQRKKKMRKGYSSYRYWHSRGPDQQAKFLEKPFREHRQDLINIVRAEVKG